jgi:tubulin-specific chaperone B
MCDPASCLASQRPVRTHCRWSVSLSSHWLATRNTLRKALQCTVEEVKRKLAFHCGSNASTMSLQLKNRDDKLVAQMSDDARKFGYYSPQNGFILHVIDADPYSASANGWLEDVSKVPKYVMSDADYDKRENTYRKYKESKLAKDPNWTLERELAERQGRPAPMQSDLAEYTAEAASHIAVGDRCEVAPGGRRGTVRFVGPVDALPGGVWIGVEYDEPLGRHNGSIGGKACFQCPPQHGAFVRAPNVHVGDFSEVDLLGSDDEV